MYTYSDFDITFITDEKNDLKKIIDSDAVKAAIKNILLTKKGEKPFNPEFGSNIKNYLFEPMSILVAEDLKEEIKTSINTWEKRVTDLIIDVYPIYEDDMYIIEIKYKDVILKEIQTLTFSLVLE